MLEEDGRLRKPYRHKYDGDHDEQKSIHSIVREALWEAMRGGYSQHGPGCRCRSCNKGSNSGGGCGNCGCSGGCKRISRDDDFLKFGLTVAVILACVLMLKKLLEK